MISRNTKRLIVIICIIAIIPAVAYATKSNADLPAKTKEAIYKIVTQKEEPLKFPVGEQPKPVPPAPKVAPKPVAKPVPKPVPVTGNCVSWIQQAGIKDVTSAYKLIMRESGCRVNATNRSSGAYGIPQSLPASKMASAGADWRTNPITQLRWMNNYCLSRYGSWANAYRFQISHGWY